MVVIAVVATVFVVGHRSGMPRSAHRAVAPSSDYATTGLAVFRQPQTAKDRTFAAVVSRAARLGRLSHNLASSALYGIVASQTRYIETLPDGREVFLTMLTRSAAGFRKLPADGERPVRLIIVSPEGKWNDGQPIITVGLGDVNNRIAGIEARMKPGCGAGLLWRQMPNDVARVRWQLPRQDRYGYVYSAPLALSIPARGNLAIAVVHGRASCDQPSVTTLYARDGRVIGRVGNPSDLNAITRPIRHGNPPAALNRLDHRPSARK